MPKQQKKLQRGETRLILDPVLEVSHVNRLRADLDAALTDGVRVELDASRVERIDAAAMQLLNMAQRHAQSLKLPLCWVDPSPALTRADRLLGLNLIGERRS